MHKFPWMQKVHPLSYLMGYAEGQGPWWRARQGCQQGLNWSSFHEIHHNSPLSGCRRKWDTSLVKTVEPEHKLAGSFFHVFGLSPQLNIPWNVGNDERKKRDALSLQRTHLIPEKGSYSYRGSSRSILMATSKPQCLWWALKTAPNPPEPIHIHWSKLSSPTMLTRSPIAAISCWTQAKGLLFSFFF